MNYPEIQKHRDRSCLAFCVMFTGLIILSIVLAGCDTATDVIARAIDKGCEHGMTPTGLEGRKAAVEDINSKTETGNHTPSDCDSDGLPDFEIDEDGIPQ